MGLVTPCISTAGSSWENKANRCYDTHRQVPAAGRQRVVAPLAEGAALDIVACDCVAVVNIAITHSRNPLFAWLTSGSACRGDCILHPQGVSSTIVFSPCCAHRTAQRWQQRPRRPARAPRAASASASTQPGGGGVQRGAVTATAAGSDTCEASCREEGERGPCCQPLQAATPRKLQSLLASNQMFMCSYGRSSPPPPCGAPSARWSQTRGARTH